MKSYRFFIIVVSVLVVINCALLAAFWFKQSNNNFGPPPAVNKYLSKELNLTAAQENQYDIMRKKHFETTQKLNEQSRLLRDDFFDNIKTAVLDTEKTNTIEKKITGIQVSLDTVTLNHFRAFRTILDKGQQEKFDHIIQNALHMMGGPPRGRGNGPGPNQMPPPPYGQGPPPNGMPPPPGN